MQPVPLVMLVQRNLNPEQSPAGRGGEGGAPEASRRRAFPQVYHCHGGARGTRVRGFRLAGGRGGGGGSWHEAMVWVRLPLAAPSGLSPLLILTLCGSERVLVVSTEPPDDLSCLATPGVGCPGDGLLPVPVTRCIQMHTPSPLGGVPTQH